MKKILGLSFIMLAAVLLRAQPSPAFPAGVESRTGVIRGKVVEASTGTPVEYATVSLYKAADSALVDGMISDPEGYFEFKKVVTGTYNVIIRFMGFRKTFIRGVVISDDKPVNDLGIVRLNPDVTDLKEVEIVGDKPLVEYKIDRKVVNVDQQINAQGGTAVDVLENVPSVRTDLEGNVELRGSSTFTVLIDGKPSIITGSDALNQIPASSIDKIEIITNPSAKYDPDGTAGIINIITKKNSLQGLSGIINLSGGTGPVYSGDFTLNYRTKKTSITFGADYSNREMKMYRSSYRETYFDDSTSYLQSSNDGKMGRNSITLKAGIDHDLAPKNSVSVEANYRSFSRTRNNDTRNVSWNSNDENQFNYLTVDQSDSKHPSFQATVRDIQKFNREGSELSMQLTYNQGPDKTDQFTRQYLVDDTWEPSNTLVLNYRRYNEEIEKEWRGDFDLKHTFNDASALEAGFQMRLENSAIDNQYYEWDSLAGDWALNDPASDRYDFKNNIYAMYGTYSREFEKISFKVGLRTEYTDRLLDQKKGGEKYPYESFDFYPSAYITYFLPYNQQLQLNYSKRVNRPHSFMLNPYTYFSDAFSTFQGNPDLEPEFAHSLELNYQKYFGYSYVTIESYYRLTTNKMTRIQEVNDEGVLVMTMENLDKDQAIGAELMGNIKVNDWFNIVPTASIYDYKIYETTSGVTETRRSTNWNARIDLQANLKTKTSLRLNGMYDGPSVTVNGTREGSFFMGFSARQEFFDRKLAVIFNIRDLLDSRKMKSTSEGVNFYNYDESWRQAPMFSLSLSYKFNNYNSRRNRSAGDFDGDYDVINMF